jgi:hypothetical protein
MTTTIDGSNSVTINSGAILGITSGTAVASTSGTSIEFISIPSWVKRITVMFTGVSTNGATEISIQLGTGVTPTYTTSGYIGTCAAAGNSGTAMSTGFLIGNTAAAAQIYSGQVIISNFSGNTWVESSIISPSAAAQSGPRYGSGYVPLAAALTAIRVTAGGTDTFDAGSINILYE